MASLLAEVPIDLSAGLRPSRGHDTGRRTQFRCRHEYGSLFDRYYSGVTRYTTSTFLRMKLGDALQKRDVAPQIYESRAEAQRALTKP